MSFKEFDTTEMDEARTQYADEAKQRWGSTDAYKQSRKKTEGYSKEDWYKVNEQMNELLQQFAEHIGTDCEDAAVQELVGKWQKYLTDTYYDCSKEILSGLGQMYMADERYTRNMDKFLEGTTKLISDAIAVYCKN